MRVGIVCPYSLDVPGGVQNHVTDLAEALIERGHSVSVLAPAERDALPPYVVPTGRTVAVPYNGAVARVSFGPVLAARCRRWLREGDFDVLHLHEPATPSLSLLALWAAECPVVATYHTTTERSRALSAAAAILRPSLEKISARIAVSEDARGFQVSHVGGEPLVIPNGVYVDRFASTCPRDEWRGTDGTVVFVGRLAEQRKGFALLAEVFGEVAAARPGLRLLVVGGGDIDEARAHLPPHARDQVTFLGAASESDKAAALATADVCVAPNTGQESFGIVLVEAMAAGTTVLASDLPAFRRVLENGSCGELFRAEDAHDLASRLTRLLDNPERRAALVGAASTAVRRYDWATVATRIIRVYETVVQAGDLMDLWLGVGVLVLVVAVLLGAWLTWTANRLDRMHHRIDVSRGTLDAQLLRRSGATLELASSDALDPASRLVLLDAAHAARNAGRDDFERAESALSVALRAVFGERRDVAALTGDPGLAPLVEELAGQCAKVELARRFLNDAVVSARVLRSRRRVRWLHLAGTAPPLRTVDLDDVPPSGLVAA